MKLGADRQDYILLWAFAAAGDQAGFALDAILEYEARFGRDEVSKAMKAPILEWLNEPDPPGRWNLFGRARASIAYRLRKRFRKAGRSRNALGAGKPTERDSP